MPQSEVPLPPQAPVPDKREIVRLLSNEANQQELFRRADAVRKENVGDEVHLRGLIEFSNICRNNCLYWYPPRQYARLPLPYGRGGTGGNRPQGCRYGL